MLKQIHDKQDKMSQMVEAAHGTRNASNEKCEISTSHKKPTQHEMMNNMTAINDFAAHLEKFEKEYGPGKDTYQVLKQAANPE